ncbi:MAG: hypothetical protein IKN38_07260 [Clostridia bacterium]|nr:hypothetical protein [Clostridia bacterium]
MKKLICILLALSLVPFFAGCGEEEAKTPDEVSYYGEKYGPIKINDGTDGIYIGVDTGFIYIFDEADTETSIQSFVTRGFDDIEYSKQAIRTDDMNFDGSRDLAIPFRRLDDHQFYYTYLWNNDTGMYTYDPDLMQIGDLEVCDGYLTGVKGEHGAYEEMNYYWQDGKLVSEEAFDQCAEAASAFAASLIEGGATVSFARDELVDMTICKLYFASAADEVKAYIAVSYDCSRAFYSPATDVYFEIKPDGDGYKTGQSYSKLAYGGAVLGYSREAYSSLSDNQKEYYDMIEEKIKSFETIDFESPDAPAAMEAFMKDNPVWSWCFIPKIVGYSVTGRYYYAWADYEENVSGDVLSEKMDEYRKKMTDVVSEMPTGLEPIEKYVYLAEKLQVLEEEEHHHGSSGDGYDLTIPGDSLYERSAKTYTYMCEIAELYCTWDGGLNHIMDGAEKKTVDLYNAFVYPAGSDGWFEVFYAED